MEYYRNPNSSPSLLIRDAGLLFLRFAVAASLTGWHAAREAEAGWRHLWEKTPWPFRENIDAFGFPAPLAVSITAVCASLLSAAFLLAGLVSRTAAAVLLVFCALTAFLYRNFPAVLETSGLYAAILAVLLFCGPGRFSLESVLLARRKRRL